MRPPALVFEATGSLRASRGRAFVSTDQGVYLVFRPDLVALVMRLLLRRPPLERRPSCSSVAVDRSIMMPIHPSSPIRHTERHWPSQCASASRVNGPASHSVDSLAYAVSIRRDEAAVLWRNAKIERFTIAGGRVENKGEPILTRGRRFSRSLVLTDSGILTTRLRDDESTEELVFYSDAQGNEAQSESLGKEGNDRRVFSIATLDGSQYLLGIQNRKTGEPEIALVALRENRPSVIHIYNIPSGQITDHQSVPNAVACIHVSDYSGYRMITIGCTDGRVLHSLFLPDESRENRVGFHEIGKLSAQVWSVNACTVADRVRVTAGCADGTIQTWQSETRSEQEENVRLPGAFEVLSSVREQQAVVLIDRFVMRDQGQNTVPVLLAVTRNGRAALFSDLANVTDGSTKDRERELIRPRVPGQRLERFDLRVSAFAAAALEPTGKALDKGAIRSLLFVHNDSNVRRMGLLQPKRSVVRKQAFHMLWGGYVNEFGQMEDVRMPEALRRHSPNLWLLPVPYLFNHLEAKSLQRWTSDKNIEHFPSYYRPVLEAINSLKGLLASSEANELLGMGREFASSMRSSLRHAFQMRDKFLFKELLENSLKAFNRVLKRICQRSDQRLDGALLKVYNDLLLDTERACRYWLGVDYDAYAKVQVTRIKNLVDGDILCWLSAAEASGRKQIEKIVQLRTRFVRRAMLDWRVTRSC